jgi:hypothetical protein
VTTQNLTGTRNATQATFTLEDGVTSFTAFCGKDRLSGELEVDAAAAMRGTWRVRKWQVRKTDVDWEFSNVDSGSISTGEVRG